MVDPAHEGGDGRGVIRSDPKLMGGLPLSVSEARLESLLDLAVNGIMIIDEHGRVLMFNKACERLFGYTAAEMLGRNVSKLMTEDHAARHDAHVSRYLETGVRRIIGIARELRGQHKDGTIFPIELSVGEAPTPHGLQFIGILRDLRARKEAEDRLAELQAQLVHMARVNAMDEMGAALAHELNQPLTAIMLYLQAITRSAKDAGALPAGLDDVLQKAIREAARAGAIIHRMRGFIEKREPHRTRLMLHALIDEAVELTRLGSRAAQVHIARDYAPSLPPVDADPVQVQQVLVNLVRNAIEAARDQPNPKVRIETADDGENVRVSVSDNGPGIAPEAVGTLFKAFNSGKRSGQGLGLGLAISRTIAQSHGGDLTVDPGGDGRGAKFDLFLPTCRAA